MTNPVIAFIGCGNMARSLIGGLIADGFPAAAIRASDPDAAQRESLGRHCGVAVFADNTEAVEGATVIVAAVKPQVMRQVLSGLAGHRALQQAFIVSIAAGIRHADLQRWLGGATPVVRAMPNTPALLGCGISGLWANKQVSASQRESAESIMRAVGAVIWLEDESQLDAVTAVSGSGPAYFFLFMEAIADAARELGLSEATARLLTVETALGAARMALETDEDLATLRRHVTSPGGTTAAALEVLDNPQLRELLRRAIEAARHRATQLGNQFGSD